ncbi:MAG: hypothetical protein RL095_2980 [Verrucomicrobiota bacterium]|jgi:3-methyladenine DNA glycosylase AlkC
MADALKHHLGPAVVDKIAGDLSSLDADFPSAAFRKQALKGLEDLELMPRGRHIAQALQANLPGDFPRASRFLMASFGPPLERTEDNGMAVFFYLPHAFWVQDFGLGHFDEAMAFQYQLTQRFTAEFSIRPFLEQYSEATLKLLRTWAGDSSPHVRRLVSEGTRPRLPWAPRLRRFQVDPAPVLELLELLKDDRELYVRRSVANNLNDIGKDHPGLLLATAEGWLRDAGAGRQWLVNHALRSLVKGGDLRALRLLGFAGSATRLEISGELHPREVAAGGEVRLACAVRNSARRPVAVLIDWRVFFRKAGGAASPKVFKGGRYELGAGDTCTLEKKLSLRDLSTRRHFPGRHEVEVLVNGQPYHLGAFELLES